MAYIRTPTPDKAFFLVIQYHIQKMSEVFCCGCESNLVLYIFPGAVRSSKKLLPRQSAQVSSSINSQKF
ncbi:CLUMA_CG001765, isoform A [Clunio marinus]|uniref:CLUMA_CG001765, isoform A n=1 Tax=Clunio marinus TaxID=568069 RepID=A0A1J1HJ89_9DIPT|nr:CLUMA_CG001765, isoform A [Clunio marinus]